jgi:hypothetical protein
MMMQRVGSRAARPIASSSARLGFERATLVPLCATRGHHQVRQVLLGCGKETTLQRLPQTRAASAAPRAAVSLQAARGRHLSTAAAPAAAGDGAFAREVQRWDPQVPIERATTPPASWYTSPDVYRKEAPLVFHHGWQQGTCSAIVGALKTWWRL